jgi:antitoxin (DNA-binding transcriptional repressor) of toxin-antitoxin stability system
MRLAGQQIFVSFTTVGGLTIPPIQGYFSHMKQAKVSDLKNQLSRYLDYVRNGETVLVLDRKIPVAELRPVSEKISSGRIAALERKGIIRRGRGQFSAKFLKSLPAGKPAGVVAALLDEREKGDEVLGRVSDRSPDRF